MDLDDFIEQTDWDWAVKEMEYYDEYPEHLATGEMVPNFEHVEDEQKMTFYLGLLFGIGLTRKYPEELQDSE